MSLTKCMNIPQLSVGEAVKLLAFAYGKAVKDQLPMKCLPSAMFWGPPGVGKSQGVRQLADQLQRETGKKVVVTDVRLLLFNPVDLRGLPTAKQAKTLAVWLKPRIFHMDESTDTVNILFLDEISAAPPSVQAAAYQICLDRRVGEHELPQNCLVIAAGNRITDGGVAYRMPKPLCNRMMHLEIMSDFLKWKKWAVETGIDARVIGFIAADNSRLNTVAGTDEVAFCTPRSWEMVSNMLKFVCDDPRQIRPLIGGCVGEDTAIAFEAWCRSYDDLPEAEEILAGRCNRYPRRQDSYYTLNNSLLTALRCRGEKLTARELENVCEYVLRFPPDYGAAFFEDLRAMEELKLKLMDCRALKTWIARG